jgi:hypothetical protein
MNMTTSLDSIPLKTSSKNNDMILDDSDDPMVKDILNEFQQELEINTQKQPILNEKHNYNINYNAQNEDKNICSNGSCNIPNKNKNTNTNINSYYNEVYIKKSFIIIIIVFLIFSPLVIPLIFEKLPQSFVPIIENYDLYIKIFILFISIYILFFYNLL